MQNKPYIIKFAPLIKYKFVLVKTLVIHEILKINKRAV